MKLLTFLSTLSTVMAFPFSLEASIIERAASCGGVADFTTCGGAFPADFCCPLTSTCLPLNITGAVGVVCCPAGSDCHTIATTPCDPSAYDPSKVPGNTVHMTPVPAPSTCGSQCCPAGYSCENDNCVALSAASASVSTVSSSPTASTSSPASQTATATATPITNVTQSAGDAATITATQSFSGSSFAAGFVPGLVIGMLLLLAILWLWARRRRARDEMDAEKSRSVDQLTSYTPNPQTRPFAHNRSISEPTATPSGGHRVEFLRSNTQEQTEEPSADAATTISSLHSTTDNSTSRPLYRFSVSPQRQPSPLPAHMKRGTLSYTISPIRRLKSKRSMHSLRRHMLDSTSMTSQSLRPQRSQRSNVIRSDSTGSTETIQVLMSDTPYTPEQRAGLTSRAPAIVLDTSSRTADANQRPVIPSSVYSPPQPVTTPTKQSSRPQPAVLGSPYSPSQYRVARPNLLEPPRQDRPRDSKRMTTFSNLLERAGFYRDSVGHARR